MRLCIICKAEIAEERLSALPGTRLCTQHGEEIQQYGGEFIVSASQERTSKSSSLKINYGGISTEQKRNVRALEQLQDEYERRYFEQQEAEGDA